MPNIPGISGYSQPGVFARDLIRTTASSLGGVGRLLVLMGEGITEVEIVASAKEAEDGVGPATLVIYFYDSRRSLFSNTKCSIS